MPAQHNPREGGGVGPGPSNQDQNTNGADRVRADPAVNERRRWPEEREGIGEGCGGEVEKGGDEADPGGVSAGEGEVVDRNGDVHVLVVERAGAAEEELDQADEGEVEEEAEDERGEERADDLNWAQACAWAWDLDWGWGQGQGWGDKEGEGEGKEEAEVGGDFEEEKDEVRKERFGEDMETLGERRVESY